VIAPGWVNEVEHIARAPIPTLIVYSADREDRDPNYSTMLPAEDEIPGLVTRAFTDQRRLPALVAGWLTERVSRLPSPASGRHGGDIDPRFITTSGLGYARGSNATYSGGSATLGSAYPETAVGSGGSCPDPMQEQFDHQQDMERLARRLASGKTGPPPPLIRRGDGTVREMGGPSASEPEEEEGPDPTKSS
jgi:hypothetical protein